MILIKKILLFILLSIFLSVPLFTQEELDKKDVYENYYIEPKSYGTERLLPPPVYARTLSETNYETLKDLNWIDAGIDYRTRYEYRENDLRREDSRTDRPLLLRARGFVALKEKFDPFRITLEVEDAQRQFSKYKIDSRDYNRAEPINAFFELYYRNGLGTNRPFSIQYGIMSFELLDRRLIGSNEWRNTTNTFQGLRMSLGKDQNNWSVEILVLQPLERIPNEFDKRVRNQIFGGVIGHIRNWSEIYNRTILSWT